MTPKLWNPPFLFVPSASPLNPHKSLLSCSWSNAISKSASVPVPTFGTCSPPFSLKAFLSPALTCETYMLHEVSCPQSTVTSTHTQTQSVGKHFWVNKFCCTNEHINNNRSLTHTHTHTVETAQACCGTTTGCWIFCRRELIWSRGVTQRRS